MKEFIREQFVDFVTTYQKEHGLENIWRTPLICFTDVKSPYVRKLPEIVNPEHVMPEVFLEDATVAMVYFLPFSKEIIDSNVGQKDASELWARGYLEVDKAVPIINRFLIDLIESKGYRAVVPIGISMDEEKLISNWSHRHVAYAGGMGTFGINNMLITKQGCSGRYATVISNVDVVPDEMLDMEYCIYKRNGKCRKCVENCFSGALTLEGFDRFKCYEQCMKNIDVFGVDVCGKCATGIPCALKAPI